MPRGVAWLTLLAFVLRVPDLARNGLWLDEVYVHNDVLRPLGQLFHRGVYHVVHFMLLKPLLFLHDSPFFLRLPSALSGVLAVPVIYLAVRRLLDAHAAFAAALLLAVSPFAVNYAHDANYYSNEILFCLLGLYFFARFRTGGGWLNALWMALCSAAVFFVHPVCGIYLACLWLCWFLALAATPGQWNAVLQAPRQALRLGPKLLLPLAALGALVFFLWPFFWRVLGNFLQGISLGETPFGVEFSYKFFYEYFRRFGPAFWKTGPATVVWAYLFFVLFLVGCASAARRGWIVSTLLWLPFVLSFLVLFNIKYARYFHIRYFSYLTPLYLIGAAEGIGFLARRASPLLARIPRLNLTPPRAMAAGAGLLALTVVPQLAYFYRIPGANWDAAFRVARKKAGREAVFAYTNFAEKEMANYYLPRFGFDPRQAIRLGEPSRQNPYLPHALKQNILRHPDLWLISSWTEILPEPLVNWARKNMTLECYAPSALIPANEIYLYHWPYGRRCVFPPKKMVYRPAEPETAADSSLARVGVPAAAWQETFFFDRSTSYQLALQLANPGRAAARFRLQLDGAEAGAVEAPPVKASQARLGPLSVSEGPHRLGLELLSPPSDEAVDLREIQIAAIQPDSGFCIAGMDAESISPSGFVWFVPFGGRTPLTMKRKAFAAYSFDLNRGGQYEILVQALNDRPGPVWLECLLDDNVQGILSFDRADNSWQKKGFAAQMDEGRHRFSVYFLNEGDVSGDLPRDKDNDAIVDDICLRPVKAGEPIRDERWWKPDSPPLLAPLASTSAASRLDSRWQIPVPKPYEFIDAPGPEKRGVQFAIARDDPPFGMFSPAFPVPPSRRVYYSARLRADNLNNDSVNLLTVFLDQDGNTMGRKFVNLEGLTGTTDWVRFVEFVDTAPEGARSFMTLFATYHNSRRMTWDTGRVSLADLEVHERK